MFTEMKTYLGKGSSDAAPKTEAAIAHKKRVRRIHAISAYFLIFFVVIKMIFVAVIAFSGGRKFERRRLEKRLGEGLGAISSRRAHHKEKDSRDSDEMKRRGGLKVRIGRMQHPDDEMASES